MRRHYLCSLLVVSGCSLEPANDGRSKIGSIADAVDSTNKNDSDGKGQSMASITAFEGTVYQLVRTVTCKNCHASELSPLFASSNVREAHSSVVNTQKVNFNSPRNSRLVQRLANENHNCWSDCGVDADEMQTAIEEWIRLSEINSQGSEVALKTKALSLTDAQTKEAPTMPGTIIMEGEDGNLRSPMRVQSAANASGGEFIVTPTGNGGLLQAGNPAAGAATYTVEITEPGPYRVWGLVSTANSNQNSFFLRANNGGFFSWRLPVTNGQWEWNLASDQDEGGNILSLNLALGSHVISVSQREDGSRLDVLALTNNPNFSGDSRGGEPVKVLRYDVSRLVDAPGAYFEIEAVEFDQFSFKFKNPALISESARLRIKGVKVMINDVFDTQHSTFLVIDTVVDAPGAILSSAAMIVPTDKGFGLDEISIAFDELVAN